MLKLLSIESNYFKEVFMIEGYATPQKTVHLARQHPQIQYQDLGSSGLTVSPAGFGCYRVSLGVAKHEQALRQALSAGINLIDTSTNYADGNSEKLVGHLLADMTQSGQIDREAVIVVTKVGYLQGQNYALSQERKKKGKPFEDLVLYGKDIEHCIHPQFLENQISQSLKRLNLATIDLLLLHNPEYYLSWAHQNHLDPKEARLEYYRRIKQAFAYLEEACEKGQIRFYGVSSNTFPAASDDPEFTCLETLWDLAESLSPQHRFRTIQLPMNVFETGAVLTKNQPSGQSVLQTAAAKQLGVLINRPLNAFHGNQLLRLADVKALAGLSDKEVIERIRGLLHTEKALDKILPHLNLPPGLQNRLKAQLAVSDALKHYWRNFGSYERWRQVKSSFFVPRIEGVMMFFSDNHQDNDEVQKWMTTYHVSMQNAFNAVDSRYAGAAARKCQQISQVIASADAEWSQAPTLSQKTIRALRSTSGVSAVLVGMRRQSYVADVLSELQRSITQKKRLDSWSSLHHNLIPSIA
jgi:aryl-alcohol dehydrogenase-like predicted oxidoreductase